MTLTLIVLLGLLGPVAASDTPVPHPPDLEAGEFDPAAWDTLLRTYVVAGGVDYARWKADGTAALDAFLEDAAGYDLGSVFGKEPKAGFLINVYNAWVVRQVLEHYPLETVDAVKGFFDENPVVVGGTPMTLDAIEARLAELMRQAPRTLFALAPAMSGYPRLRGWAYTSARLEEGVGEACREYFDRTGLRFDRETRELTLNPVLEEHLHRFEAPPGGLRRFVAGFLSVGQVVALGDEEMALVFPPPDRSLDDAGGAEAGSGTDGR